MPIHAGPFRRAIEVAAATLILVVTSPLIVICTIVSVAVYRSSPFFVHDRIGLNGERFHLYKVRTLPPATDRYADKYALKGSGAPAVMLLIRRLHLDELPQLLHVLRGQMSMVGPRPEMPCLHESLPEDFARLRTSVRPGLTCLWQISPHNRGLIGERSEYDRLYVDYRNPRLDLWILGQTARKMTLGREVHLHEVPRWVIGQPPVADERNLLVAPAQAKAGSWGSGAAAEPARSSA